MGSEEKMVDRIEKRTRNATMCHNMTVKRGRGKSSECAKS
jgi:hypothetical protein